MNVGVAEALADGPAVLMINHAGRLVENLPAALPRQVAEIRVFQVEGCEDTVKSTEFKEFPAVDRAGTAATIETRKQVPDGGLGAVADA